MDWYTTKHELTTNGHRDSGTESVYFSEESRYGNIGQTREVTNEVGPDPHRPRGTLNRL